MSADGCSYIFSRHTTITEALCDLQKRSLPNRGANALVRYDKLQMHIFKLNVSSKRHLCKYVD